MYREQLAAGYTAVGEFHYLGYEEALAAAAAAEAAGLELVLLYAAYGRGGLARFRQESPAAYLADVERLAAGGTSRGAGAALRPRVPARLARGDRALRDLHPTPGARTRVRAAS